MSRGGDHDAAEAMLPNGASSRRVGLPVSIGSLGQARDNDLLGRPLSFQ